MHTESVIKMLIASLTKGIRGKLIFLLFITIIVQSQNVLISYVMGIIVDGLTSMKFSWVLQVLVFVCILIIAITALSTLQAYISSHLQFSYQHKLKELIYEHLFRVKLSSLIESVSAICEKIDTDTLTCANYVMEDKLQVYIDAVLAFLITGILFFVDWQICLLVLLLAILNIGIYMISYQKMFRIRKAEKDAQTASFSREVMWMGRGKLVRLEHLYTNVKKDIHAIYTTCEKAMKHSLNVSSAYNFICSMISSLSLILIIYLSLKRIQVGEITVGEFVVAFNFFNMLVTYISSILNFGSKKQEMHIAITRLDTLMDLEEESEEGIILDSVHDITIKNLTIFYGDTKIVKHLTCKFKQGNSYVIKGANGAGKSSLLDVLSGFQAYEAEAFLINDIPFSELQVYHYRKNCISYALQQPYVIQDTVLNNINFGQSRNTTMLFRLDSLNNRDIHEDNISQGEKRKIVLNRAFVKDVSLYLLDEPESFLDADAKKKVIDFLMMKKSDRMIIIVSHDKDIIQCADEVIDLEESR
ncbi:ABC transporter ATP-binding protein [Longicatena caecimuris]|uniref:ATP-binding cassette domain-containing protein n=1 Tax=Longicatena caecimuris TaxID=1796635 RepID=UPI0022E6956D|nr:ABC transporter ATP-binding protein [Longicatena caecimuris]